VPVLELIRRLDARSHTPEKMPYDSSAATIVARLEEHQQPEPVLDYYQQQNQVIEIDGTGTDETVYERLREPVLRAVKNLK